jgi:hypothetical protein
VFEGIGYKEWKAAAGQGIMRIHVGYEENLQEEKRPLS